MGKSHKRQLFSVIIFLFSAVFLFTIANAIFARETVKNIQASTDNGFEVVAETHWDDSKSTSYVKLEWDNIADLSSDGYHVYQAQDSTTWEEIKINEKKNISILCIESETEQDNSLINEIERNWNEGASFSVDSNIELTKVKLDEFNKEPQKYLLNQKKEYKYDALFIGIGNWGSEEYLTNAGVEVVQEYIDNGHDVLLGHNIVTNEKNTNFDNFSEQLGIGTSATETDKVESLKIDFNEDEYIITRNNLGILQIDYTIERKSEESSNIRDAIYTFLQEGLRNNATNYAVNDTSAPQKPSVKVAKKEDESLTIRIDTKDIGEKYQWYIQATNKNEDILKSQVIDNEISSNIAGYFYQITSNPSHLDFKKEIETRKNDDGKFVESDFDLYVAPKNNEVSYKTEAELKINESSNSKSFVQVVAADRMGNISEVETVQICELVEKTDIKTKRPQPRVKSLDFAVERTGNIASLVDINLGAGMNQSMEVLEVKFPKNLSLSPVALPASWQQYQTINGVNYDSIIYTMGNNNSSNSISIFLSSLRFSIGAPINEPREIRILFYENLRKTIEVTRDNFLEYFSLIDEEDIEEDFQGQINSHYDVVTGIFTYTQNASFRQGGFYLNNRISFDDDFNLEGRVNLGDKSGRNGGSDGIGFLLHPGRSNSVGKLGGYLGVGGIANGMGFVLDTYHNPDDHMYSYPDPVEFANNSYGALVTTEGEDGKKRPYMGEDAPGRVIPDPENNIFRDIRIEYTHTNHTLRIQYDNDNSLIWEKDISDWLDAETTSYAFSSQGATGAHSNLQQFEIERFLFTEVIEFTEDNTGDVSFSAAIPQKIILQGYTERFGQTQRFNRADIVYDQQLRIGDEITVQPNDFELFEFLELRNRAGAVILPGARPLNVPYTVTNVLQEGALIYENRQVMLHVRQVVLEPNNQLVNPEEGYLNIKTSIFDSSSHTHIEDTNQLIQTRIPSQGTEEVPEFETFVVSTKHMTNQQDQLKLDLVLPEFYEYLGHFLTPRHFEDPGDPMGADHQDKTENDVSGGNFELPRVALDMEREYFVTLYIKPTTIGQSPQPYSWDYKHNDLGAIKTE